MTRPRGSAKVSTEVRAATEYGRLCAQAGLAQRRLREHAAGYGDLFTATTFDDVFFSSLALVGTYCAPDAPAEQLALSHRAGLWVFGMDRLIDSVCRTREDVDAVVAACRAAALGDAGTTEVSRFLADLRRDLSASPAFPLLGPLWQDEVARTLTAMVREWDWRALASAQVSLDEYSDNVDSVGFGVVYLAHWIAIEHLPKRPEDTAALVAAGRQVAALLRLVNDLGTHQRERGQGDMNALALGVSAEALIARVGVLVQRCQQTLAPFRRRHPRLTRYLDRHIGFNIGFYGDADYWGQG